MIKLFVINIVAKSLFGSFNKLSTILNAFKSELDLMSVLDKENNATSDPEINPDKINKIANNIISELN